MAGTAVQALAIGDIDGDGTADIVSSGSDGVRVYRGLGGGRFGAASVRTSATQGATYNDINVTDLNGDGVLDIVATGGSTIGVSLGVGDGTFRAEVTIATSSITEIPSVQLGDLNGDGKSDLVVVGTDGSGLTVTSTRLGRGDGSFSAETTSQYVGTFGSSSSILADLNGDGNLDLLSSGGESSFYYNQIAIQLGRGDGTFGSASLLMLSTAGYGDGQSSLATGDINGDGVLDIISNSAAYGTFDFNQQTSILLGNTRDESLQSSPSP